MKGTVIDFEGKIKGLMKGNVINFFKNYVSFTFLKSGWR